MLKLRICRITGGIFPLGINNIVELGGSRIRGCRIKGGILLRKNAVLAGTKDFCRIRGGQV